MSSFSTPDPSASNWRWIAALLVITGAVVLGARAYYSNQIKTLNTIIQDLQTHADQQAEELTRTRATLTQAEQHKARLSEELRQAESRAFARLPGSLRKTAERLSAQANRLDQLSVNIGTEMEVLEQTLTRPSAPAPDSPSEAGPR